MTSPMDFRTALKHGIAQLRAAHISSDTLAAELLLLHATHRERTFLYSHPEAELSPDEAALYQNLLERRISGVPVQHLTGRQEFWGLSFEVTPDVLIPRPETEHLIEVALDRLALRELRAGRPNKNDGAGLLIADIGTGSGCIAVALAKELPQAQFVATDISAAAISIAQRNSTRLGFFNRIRFQQSNLIGALSSSTPVGSRETEHGPQPPSSQSPVTSHQSLLFDLIISNPPYIGRREASSLPREVRDHEPELALYGGEEGYEFYADLITQSAAQLKLGGLLVLELGDDSLPAVRPLLDVPDWANVSITKDLADIPRVIAAERASVVDTNSEA